MILWVDAHLSPRTARWLSEHFGISAVPVRDLGLRDASDKEIFQAARTADAVVMTKDLDFVEMLERSGPPPRVLWLTCGNTSNHIFKLFLTDSLTRSENYLTLESRWWSFTD